MSDQTQHSDGRRTVGLYLPFTSAGLRIEAITFEPCTYGHLIRWQGGAIPSALALMVELSGRKLHEIESIRHPDDSRVMDAFLDHVHPAIADDVRNGVRPLSTASGAVYNTVRGPAIPDPLARFREPEGGEGASDAFGGYDGFDPEPTPQRPLDYVEGLDPP